MRVLHIEGGMHLYGGAYQVFNLLRLLKGRGEHILACPKGSAIGEAARKEGLDVESIPLRGEASVGAYFALCSIIRRRKPDIVQVHSRRGADLWGVLAAKATGTKLVITRRVDNTEARWLARLRYGPACRVVGISKKICAVLESEGVPGDKLRCIRSGVDTESFIPRSSREYLREQFGIGPDETVAVMAAQFIPRKGHHTLLDTVPSVLASHPNARFLLLGKGPLLEEIQDRAKQFGGRVLVPGFRDDFSSILPECDMMVHPAEKEGLGVVILQAAACGIPVVATLAGGIPEVVEDGRSGFLVEPCDSAALAERINCLMGDAVLRKGMGVYAREYAERDLSIQAMANGNLAMYEEIMQG